MTIAAGGIEMPGFAGAGTVLFAANGHLSDLQCRTGYGAAEFQVGTDDLHIHEHIAQIAGDGDFRNGVGEFAVADPEARGAARVVAGDDIDAHSDEFRHVKSVGDGGHNALGRLDATLGIKVPVPDAGVSGEAAGSVAGGLHAELARGVAVEEITFQNAALDDHRAARGDAFIIEGRGAKQTWDGGVVNYGEICDGDLFA